MKTNNEKVQVKLLRSMYVGGVYRAANEVVTIGRVDAQSMIFLERAVPYIAPVAPSPKPEPVAPVVVAEPVAATAEVTAQVTAQVETTEPAAPAPAAPELPLVAHEPAPAAPAPKRGRKAKSNE